MAANCPNCDTNPLGESWVVNLQTRGGAEIEAILCGACGTVYAEDPAEQVAEACGMADDGTTNENKADDDGGK